MAKYDAPTLLFQLLSALLKEISPTCLYFRFAPLSSRSACEVDSLLVKLGLNKKY